MQNDKYAPWDALHFPRKMRHVPIHRTEGEQRQNAREPMPIPFAPGFELLRQANHHEEDTAKQQTPLQFVIASENQWCDNGNEQSPERATRGNHQIERGKITWMRLKPIKLAV